MSRRFVFLFIFLCFFTGFSYCNNKSDVPRIYLDDDFYWALSDYESTPEEALFLKFSHLDYMGYKNLRDLVGKNGEYIWLKVEFELPEELKNDDLSMVIPYLHFADELYLNGKYIDDYGVMGESVDDPSNQEAGYIAHLFDFPELYLNQSGKNTVLIKVLCLGSATITDGVFIGLRQDGWRTSDNMTFWRSRFYMGFEGMMLLCGLFFLMLYFVFKHEVSYRLFGVLNFLTAFFFSIFFINDLPWAGFHGGINFLWYVKFAKCICFFAMEFVFSMFICSFIRRKLKAFELAIQYLSFIISTAIVIVSPDYLWLISRTMLLFCISSLGLVCSIVYTVKGSINSAEKTKARFTLSALIFLIVSMLVDFTIKGVLRNIKLPFLSIFGWTGVIIIFFVYFCLDYSKVARRLEYLNQGLEKEIKLQTRKLIKANERLERDKAVSIKDMRMAAIVQNKFFHAPPHKLRNWDFSVRYEPLSIVSGDLYNFYHEEDLLNGVSLFDASGHGVAASLVTMLAENIIQQTYRESLSSGISVADTLTMINERFIAAKSDIENYLTGILLNTRENDDGTCTVTMANAGHPQPLMYSSDEDKVEELLPSADAPFSGPVGLDGFAVEYSQIEFCMKKGDILLLYTDGLTEVTNADKNEFNVSRVMEILEQKKDSAAEEIMTSLMDGINLFRSDTPRTDDVSVIILKRI